MDFGGILAPIPNDQDPILAGAGLLKGNDFLAEAIVSEYRWERE
jgi:hypothetical protein